MRSGDSEYRAVNLTEREAALKCFDLSRPVVVIVHGFSTKFNFERGVVREWAQVWSDAAQANVIVLDWSPWAFCNYYDVATRYVPDVAAYLAERITFLQSEIPIPSEKLIFAGHSAGGHLVGIASRKLPARVPICYGNREVS